MTIESYIEVLETKVTTSLSDIMRISGGVKLIGMKEMVDLIEHQLAVLRTTRREYNSMRLLEKVINEEEIISELYNEVGRFYSVKPD